MLKSQFRLFCVEFVCPRPYSLALFQFQNVEGGYQILIRFSHVPPRVLQARMVSFSALSPQIPSWSAGNFAPMRPSPWLLGASRSRPQVPATFPFGC